MLSTCSLLKVFKHFHLHFETLNNLDILVQLSSLLEELFTTIPQLVIQIGDLNVMSLDKLLVHLSQRKLAFPHCFVLFLHNREL